MASNKTIVTVQDISAAAPDATGVLEFDIYNEAMSYSKWLATHSSINSQLEIYVWNQSGGSGKWRYGTFTPLANTNYP